MSQSQLALPIAGSSGDTGARAATSALPPPPETDKNVVDEPLDVAARVEELRSAAYADFRVHRFDDAVAKYTAAIALDPKDAYLFDDRSHAHLYAGNFAAYAADRKHYRVLTDACWEQCMVFKLCKLDNNEALSTPVAAVAAAPPKSSGAPAQEPALPASDSFDVRAAQARNGALRHEENARCAQAKAPPQPVEDDSDDEDLPVGDERPVLLESDSDSNDAPVAAADVAVSAATSARADSSSAASSVGRRLSASSSGSSAYGTTAAPSSAAFGCVHESQPPPPECDDSGLAAASAASSTVGSPIVAPAAAPSVSKTRTHPALEKKSTKFSNIYSCLLSNIAPEPDSPPTSRETPIEIWAKSDQVRENEKLYMVDPFSCTVFALKKLICIAIGGWPDKLFLDFNGKQCDDNRTLAECQVPNGAHVLLRICPLSGGAKGSQSAAAAAASSSSAQSGPNTAAAAAASASSDDDDDESDENAPRNFAELEYYDLAAKFLVADLRKCNLGRNLSECKAKRYQTLAENGEFDFAVGLATVVLIFEKTGVPFPPLVDNGPPITREQILGIEEWNFATPLQRIIYDYCRSKTFDGDRDTYLVGIMVDFNHRGSGLNAALKDDPGAEVKANIILPQSLTIVELKLFSTYLNGIDGEQWKLSNFDRALSMHRLIHLMTTTDPAFELRLYHFHQLKCIIADKKFANISDQDLLQYRQQHYPTGSVLESQLMHRFLHATEALKEFAFAEGPKTSSFFRTALQMSPAALEQWAVLIRQNANGLPGCIRVGGDDTVMADFMPLGMFVPRDMSKSAFNFFNGSLRNTGWKEPPVLVSLRHVTGVDELTRDQVFLMQFNVLLRTLCAFVVDSCTEPSHTAKSACRKFCAKVANTLDGNTLDLQHRVNAALGAQSEFSLDLTFLKSSFDANRISHWLSKTHVAADDKSFGFLYRASLIAAVHHQLEQKIMQYLPPSNDDDDDDDDELEVGLRDEMESLIWATSLVDAVIEKLGIDLATDPTKAGKEFEAVVERVVGAIVRTNKKRTDSKTTAASAPKKKAKNADKVDAMSDAGEEEDAEDDDDDDEEDEQEAEQEAEQANESPRPKAAAKGAPKTVKSPHGKAAKAVVDKRGRKTKTAPAPKKAATAKASAHNDDDDESPSPPHKSAASSAPALKATAPAPKVTASALKAAASTLKGDHATSTPSGDDDQDESLSAVYRAHVKIASSGAPPPGAATLHKPSVQHLLIRANVPAAKVVRLKLEPSTPASTNGANGMDVATAATSASSSSSSSSLSSSSSSATTASASNGNDAERLQLPPFVRLDHFESPVGADRLQSILMQILVAVLFHHANDGDSNAEGLPLGASFTQGQVQVMIPLPIDELTPDGFATGRFHGYISKKQAHDLKHHLEAESHFHATQIYLSGSWEKDFPSLLRRVRVMLPSLLASVGPTSCSSVHIDFRKRSSFLCAQYASQLLGGRLNDTLLWGGQPYSGFRGASAIQRFMRHRQFWTEGCQHEVEFVAAVKEAEAKNDPWVDVIAPVVISSVGDALQACSPARPFATVGDTLCMGPNVYHASPANTLCDVEHLAASSSDAFYHEMMCSKPHLFDEASVVFEQLMDAFREMGSAGRVWANADDRAAIIDFFIAFIDPLLRMHTYHSIEDRDASPTPRDDQLTRVTAAAQFLKTPEFTFAVMVEAYFLRGLLMLGEVPDYVDDRVYDHVRLLSDEQRRGASRVIVDFGEGRALSALVDRIVKQSSEPESMLDRFVIECDGDDDAAAMDTDSSASAPSSSSLSTAPAGDDDDDVIVIGDNRDALSRASRAQFSRDADNITLQSTPFGTKKHKNNCYEDATNAALLAVAPYLRRVLTSLSAVELETFCQDNAEGDALLALLSASLSGDARVYNIAPANRAPRLFPQLFQPNTQEDAVSHLQRMLASDVLQAHVTPKLGVEYGCGMCRTGDMVKFVRAAFGDQMVTLQPSDDGVEEVNLRDMLARQVQPVPELGVVCPNCVKRTLWNYRSPGFCNSAVALPANFDFYANAQCMLSDAGVRTELEQREAQLLSDRQTAEIELQWLSAVADDEEAAERTKLRFALLSLLSAYIVVHQQLVERESEYVHAVSEARAAKALQVAETRQQFVGLQRFEKCVFLVAKAMQFFVSCQETTTRRVDENSHGSPIILLPVRRHIDNVSRVESNTRILVDPVATTEHLGVDYTPVCFLMRDGRLVDSGHWRAYIRIAWRAAGESIDVAWLHIDNQRDRRLPWLQVNISDAAIRNDIEMHLAGVLFVSPAVLDELVYACAPPSDWMTEIEAAPAPAPINRRRSNRTRSAASATPIGDDADVSELVQQLFESNWGQQLFPHPECRIHAPDDSDDDESVFNFSQLFDALQLTADSYEPTEPGPCGLGCRLKKDAAPIHKGAVAAIYPGRVSTVVPLDPSFTTSLKTRSATGQKQYLDSKPQPHAAGTSAIVYANHKCKDADLHIQEFTLGGFVFVVLIAQRELAPGQTVTVRYCDTPWFRCLCPACAGAAPELAPLTSPPRGDGMRDSEFLCADGQTTIDVRELDEYGGARSMCVLTSLDQLARGPLEIVAPVKPLVAFDVAAHLLRPMPDCSPAERQANTVSLFEALLQRGIPFYTALQLPASKSAKRLLKVPQSLDDNYLDLVGQNLAVAEHRLQQLINADIGCMRVVWDEKKGYHVVTTRALKARTVIAVEYGGIVERTPKSDAKNQDEFGDSDFTLRKCSQREELVVFPYRAAGLARFFNHDDKAPTMLARVMTMLQRFVFVLFLHSDCPAGKELTWNFGNGYFRK